MNDIRTNLGPALRQRSFSREYLVRLATVATVLATALTLAAALLLLPTYVFLSASIGAKQTRLAAIQTALSSGDETALSNRLASLTSDTTALLALQNAPNASALMRNFLAVTRPGVTLAGITYTPATAGKPGTLAIVGTALTRDALRSFQLALSSAQFSRGADLPVSAYAKDSNIPFTITVILAP